MEGTEFIAKLREFQVSLDMYVHRFETLEKEFNELSHQHVISETKMTSYAESIKELRTVIDKMIMDINHQKDDFFRLTMDFSNHMVKSKEFANEFLTIHEELKNTRAQLSVCGQQIAELINKTQMLQNSFSNLNTSLSKLDTTVTKNDLLIGKLDFTLKAIIGLISGLVAVIGSAVAGWDYLVKFFSK